MTELTIDELRKTQLGILKQFHKLCCENNLRYALAYGTLIGAVRHSGFIPWDDDIDVCMPRQDYEKLLKLRYDDGRFEIKNYRYTKGYYYIFSKMVDKSTFITEGNRADKNMGVNIDILPVDYLPDDKAKQERLGRKSERVKVIIDHLGSKIIDGNSLSLKGIAKIIVRVLIAPFTKLFFRAFEKSMSAYKSGEYYAKVLYISSLENEIFPSALFDSLALIHFEDSEFFTFRDYHTCLTMQYGDYMTPPPKELQVMHHSVKAYKK